MVAINILPSISSPEMWLPSKICFHFDSSVVGDSANREESMGKYFVNINDALRDHIATGGGAAYCLREFAPGIVGAVDNFFAARTDVRRLDSAELVASEILKINDLADLGHIREIVSEQELRRKIKHVKQKDHGAHTVYLYLLGVWIFDNVPQMKAAFRNKTNLEGEGDCAARFLFQWVFASLLHDVGYVFYDLSSETKSDRNKIDLMYAWEWCRRQAQSANANEADQRLLEQIHAEMVKSYSILAKPLTGDLRQNDFLEVISRLEIVPWLDQITQEIKTDLFRLLCGEKRGAWLRRYAMEVAAHGYNGDESGACVDHAVASAFLLLRYSSYWYCLMKKVSEKDTYAHARLAGGYNYDVANFEEKIIPACRSVALHNLQPQIASAKKLINEISLRRDPISFLAIFCDELQRWDRFPAGDELLSEYREYARTAPEASDVAISADGFGQDTRIVFRLDLPEEKVEQIRRTLDARLRGWRSFALVNSTREPTLKPKSASIWELLKSKKDKNGTTSLAKDVPSSDGPKNER